MLLRWDIENPGQVKVMATPMPTWDGVGYVDSVALPTFRTGENGELPQCNDANCDDLNVCNGAETCTADGGCLPGIPLDCNDGDPCTHDSCDATNGCANVFDAALCPVNEQNVVVNGDFANGTKPWRFHTNGAGSFTIINGNEARVGISAPGTNVQLYQRGIPLVGGQRYRLTFTARSNTGHDLQVSVQSHTAPYENYGVKRQQFDLTTSDQQFSAEFVVPGGNKDDARLMFWLAPFDAAGDRYFFKRISIVPVSAGGAVCGNGVVESGETCDDGNTVGGDGCDASCQTEVSGNSLLTNGDFSSGKKPWLHAMNSSGSFSVVGGQAKISVVVNGSSNQLYQPGLTIVAGRSYRLSFRARNTGGDDLVAQLLHHVSPFTSLAPTMRARLTSTMQTFVFDFTATESSDNARFRFNMGALDSSNDDYFIDDVTLVEQ